MMMRSEHTSTQQWLQRSILLGLSIVLILTASLIMPCKSIAEKIYSYLDEQGNLAWTDNYDNIPERYRAKVKITERSVTQPAQTTSFGAMHNMVTGWAQHVTGTIGSFAPAFSGFSSSQSNIATAAGLGALICIIAMYMSRSQVVKFLSLWVLVLIGIITPVLLYTSEDGIGDVMKAKAADATKKQQDRLQPVP
jgi:hypothetical protein